MMLSDKSQREEIKQNIVYTPFKGKKTCLSLDYWIKQHYSSEKHRALPTLNIGPREMKKVMNNKC